MRALAPIKRELDTVLPLRNKYAFARQDENDIFTCFDYGLNPNRPSSSGFRKEKKTVREVVSHEREIAK